MTGGEEELQATPFHPPHSLQRACLLGCHKYSPQDTERRQHTRDFPTPPRSSLAFAICKDRNLLEREKYHPRHSHHSVSQAARVQPQKKTSRKQAETLPHLVTREDFHPPTDRVRMPTRSARLVAQPHCAVPTPREIH